MNYHIYNSGVIPVKHFTKLKKVKSLRLSQLVEWLFFFQAVILGLAVYSTDSTLSSDAIKILLRSGVYLIAILLFLSLAIYIRKVKESILALILIPVVNEMVSYLHSYGKGSVRVFSLTILIAFLALPDENKKNVFVMYRRFIVCMAIFGIFFYVINLISLAGISFPHREVPYYWGNYTEYRDYGLCYIIHGGTLSARICGLFNEPGFFGTVLALLICADSINLKHCENRVMLIAGILTFSLAFVLLLILGYILLNYNKEKIIPFMLILAVLVLAVIPMLNIDVENASSFVRLLGRMAFKDGRFVGNNRVNSVLTNQLDKMFSSLQNIFWGYGVGYASEIGAEELTFMVYLLELGFFGTFIIFGIPFIVSMYIARKNHDVKVFCICFFMSIIQRPHIYNLPFFVILFGGMAFMLSGQQKNGLQHE